MSGKEHRYKVSREMGRFRREVYLPTSQMEALDLVIVAIPPIGTMQLTEKPNGELVGTTLPQRAYGQTRGAPQRISTANLEPDAQGNVVDLSCPPTRGGYTFAERVKPRGER